MYAQHRLDSLQHLDEVVVTAPITPREIVPAQHLSGATLGRLSSLSVADAIRYFAGVQLKDYGGVGGLKTINVRSMGTNHVGVFYDGVELGNAQNGTVDLGRFSLDNMEAVTLYNGQKSGTLQSAHDYASATAIYLQSRTPHFAEGEQTHLRAAFKTGSFGLANPSLLWEQQLTSRLTASLSGEYMYTTGRYRFRYRTVGYDTTAVRRNGDVNALRVETALHGTLPQGEWRTKAYLYRSERGYPGAVVRNKFSHEDRQWDTNLFVQGSFRRTFAPWYTLQLLGKYAYDYLHYLADPNRDEALMYVDNRYRQQEVYTSTAHRFMPAHWCSLSLAADYRFNLLRADLADFVFPRRHTLLVATAASVHYGRAEGQFSLLATQVDNRAIHFTPSVVLSYQPFADKELRLRAFYKRIFRMPTLNDLYYTFIGNSNLKPEYTTQYNVGVSYAKTWEHGARIALQADAYYNKVTDKIVAIPTSNFFRWTMLNLGKVDIRGVDAAVETGLRIIEALHLTARINYTYQRAQDVTDPTDSYYKGQIPYIPRHSGSAVAGADYRGWSLNYSFIYTGERYSSQANIAANYQPAWYTSDCSLAKTFPLRRGNAKAALEVNNLFNQQYEVVLSYPMPGTHFKLTLAYEF
ncbi:MAG: TonB-dependent receptor [Mediterranea sp.]|jgi:outer membrane cobalamin receptor|nr:TonB-dependent receptor [Mediterranea sp.]